METQTSSKILKLHVAETATGRRQVVCTTWIHSLMKTDSSELAVVYNEQLNFTKLNTPDLTKGSHLRVDCVSLPCSYWPPPRTRNHSQRNLTDWILDHGWRVYSCTNDFSVLPAIDSMVDTSPRRWLPKERVTQTAPFGYMDMDVFGPF